MKISSTKKLWSHIWSVFDTLQYTYLYDIITIIIPILLSLSLPTLLLLLLFFFFFFFFFFYCIPSSSLSSFSSPFSTNPAYSLTASWSSSSSSSSSYSSSSSSSSSWTTTHHPSFKKFFISSYDVWYQIYNTFLRTTTATIVWTIFSRV